MKNSKTPTISDTANQLCWSNGWASFAGPLEGLEFQAVSGNMDGGQVFASYEG